MCKFLNTLVLCMPLFLAGCVIQPVNNAAIYEGDSNAPSNALEPGAHAGGYTIKALDPLYIRFSGILEQQVLEVVVDENGEISLLHINDPIKAGGMTTSELESLIERLYVDGGIYKNVSVNVTMTAKVFYVQGQVNMPGQYQLMTGTTLLQAIAGARGPNDFANLKKVTISRHGKVYTYNIKQLEKDPSLDVKIEAGDVINIPQTWY